MRRVCIEFVLRVVAIKAKPLGIDEAMNVAQLNRRGKLPAGR